MGIWSVLDIEPTDDLSIIKRAYARKLKTTRPDQDPVGYQRLREAFEQAKDISHSGDLNPPQDRAFIDVVKAEYNEPVSQQQVLNQVDEIVTLLLADATAGFERLYTCLSDGPLENIHTREMFSHFLAEELVKRKGVTRSMLINVAAMMGWEIENFRPEGISADQLWAIYAQTENTEASQYWDSLVNKPEKSMQEHERFELLSVEGKKLAFMARLIPGYVGKLRQTVEEISAYHPVLLERVNPQLLKTLSGLRLELDWSTAFFIVFWGMAIAIGIRHDEHPLRDMSIIICVLLVCTWCKSELQRKFRHSQHVVAIYETLLSLLILGVFAKIFSGLYGQLHFMYDDPGRGPALFGMLTAFVLFLIWAICPRYWRWYNLISNSLTAFVTFPWQQAKKTGVIWRIVICAVMLFLYSWLVTWAVA